MRNGKNHCSTPDDLFRWADRRWGPFDLDVAAEAWNAKCARYYDAAQDGLRLAWRTEPEGDHTRVWCNPPWSDVEPWIARALHATSTAECARVLMLLPARAARPWWPVVAARGPISVGRIRFATPPGTPDGPGGFEDAILVSFESPFRSVKPKPIDGLAGWPKTSPEALFLARIFDCHHRREKHTDEGADK